MSPPHRGSTCPRPCHSSRFRSKMGDTEAGLVCVSYTSCIPVCDLLYSFWVRPTPWVSFIILSSHHEYPVGEFMRRSPSFHVVEYRYCIMCLSVLYISRLSFIWRMWPIHCKWRDLIHWITSKVFLCLFTSSLTVLFVMWEIVWVLTPFSITHASSFRDQSSEPHMRCEYTPVLYSNIYEYK